MSKFSRKKQFDKCNKSSALHFGRTAYDWVMYIHDLNCPFLVICFIRPWTDWMFKQLKLLISHSFDSDDSKASKRLMKIFSIMCGTMVHCTTRTIKWKKSIWKLDVINTLIIINSMTLVQHFWAQLWIYNFQNRRIRLFQFFFL